MKNAETKDRIKKALGIREMKQSELVEKTGIDKGQMSSYLAGRYKPKQENLSLIAEALGVDEAWLMGYDVPMERNEYEDQTLLRFDAELDDALEILESAGYAWAYSQSSDSDIIIKDKSNRIVACMRDYELVSRYESFQRKGSVTAEFLLTDSKQAFLMYLDSLGYHLYRDDPEHKPFMSTNELTCRLDYNTLDTLKSRIDSYTKATVDAELLSLKEEEIRQERLEKERILQQLQNKNAVLSLNQNVLSIPDDVLSVKENKSHLEPVAAHERTDIEVTEEMRKHDDDLMDNDDLWDK